MIAIRLATIDDYESICPLLRQGDEEHARLCPEVFQPFVGAARSRELIARIIDSDDSDILLAVDAGAAVGLATMKVVAAPPYPIFRPRRYAVLEDLVVDAAHRGEGIGRALLAAVRTWATQRKLKVLQANVWLANDGAARFYHALGFTPVSQKVELNLKDARPPDV